MRMPASMVGIGFAADQQAHKKKYPDLGTIPISK
jgi:hypothetical protein